MPLTGTVNRRREAMLQLTVHGPAGAATVDAIVDTGFSGSVLLPATIATRLRLPTVTTTSVRLADGSATALRLCLGEVDWLTGRQPVAIHVALSPEILLGTALLGAHRLVIDFPAAALEIT